MNRNKQKDFLTTEYTEYTESMTSFLLRILCVLWLRINCLHAKHRQFLIKKGNHE
jgi:hypothetical protein